MSKSIHELHMDATMWAFNLGMLCEKMTRESYNSDALKQHGLRWVTYKAFPAYRDGEYEVQRLRLVDKEDSTWGFQTAARLVSQGNKWYALDDYQPAV